MGAKTSASSPCASCKLLRRRCAKDCVFAPYFPPDEPQKFASVHKVFGASNVSKMLQELPVHQRPDAVSSMVYEANARLRDPVYGCVGAISYLQQKVAHLQMQLAMAQAEILCLHMQTNQQQQHIDDDHHHHPFTFTHQNHRDSSNHIDSNFMDAKHIAQSLAMGQLMEAASHHHLPQPSDCSTSSAQSVEDHHIQSTNGSNVDPMEVAGDSLWT